MMDPIDLKKEVVEKLMLVIDPETGTDVIRMRLVQNINVDEKGKITYTFRPSSPFCPIAVPLALGIMQAIREVPGIINQRITVVDYIQADQLNKLLQDVLEEN